MYSHTRRTRPIPHLKANRKSHPQRKYGGHYHINRMNPARRLTYPRTLVVVWSLLLAVHSAFGPGAYARRRLLVANTQSGNLDENATGCHAMPRKTNR